MMAPTLGSTLAPAITRPLRWVHVASHPVINIARIWMTPKGILNRIVVKLSNPNDLTIREPKLEMPPLAMLLQIFH